MIDSVMASGDASAVSASTENGVIRWEVDKDSIISKMNSYSPSIEVGGISWRILLRKTADEESIALALSLVDGDYKVFSVDVSFEFTLISHLNCADNISHKTQMTCLQDGVARGFPRFTKWDDRFDEANNKGFIKDNKLTVEVNFSLVDVVGFRKLRRIDVTDPNEISHDVAFVIEGEKIYVGKQYLSVISPVFQAMFYGDFSEKNKKEIELKDVDRKEFMEMLNLIYPPYQKITDENFEFLLKLGDRFDVDLVANQVEQFLITSTTVSIAAKLVHADRFRLYKLMNNCLGTLNTIKDVTDLKKSVESKQFSSRIKGLLFDKLNEFSE